MRDGKCDGVDFGTYVAEPRYANRTYKAVGACPLVSFNKVRPGKVGYP